MHGIFYPALDNDSVVSSDANEAESDAEDIVLHAEDIVLDADQMHLALRSNICEGLLQMTRHF